MYNLRSKWKQEKLNSTVSNEHSGLGLLWLVGEFSSLENLVWQLLVETVEKSTTQKLKMTFWADNLKFIKDILDSKYKKIEDAIAEVSILFLLKHTKWQSTRT
jgi:hypothetical protein